MNLSAYDAYQAMTTAFNRGDFWAAASLAVALHDYLLSGTKEARRFAKGHGATILEVERTSKRHLEQEATVHV